VRIGQGYYDTSFFLLFSLSNSSITAKGMAVLAAALGRKKLGGLKCVLSLIGLIVLVKGLSPLTLLRILDCLVDTRSTNMYFSPSKFLLSFGPWRICPWPDFGSLCRSCGGGGDPSFFWGR
jgi:hypothetical protein